MMKIPADWKLCSLDEFIERLDAGVSVNSEDVPASEGEWGVLKSSCASDGRFRPEENKRILPEEIHRARVPVRENTIIISRSNTRELVGESALINQDYPYLFHSDKLWQAIFRNDILFCPRWLSQVFISTEFRKQVGNLATGTSGSMKNISKEVFLSIEIPTPTFEEQKRIADILMCWGKHIDQTENLIAAKTRFKRGLMQQLLTGKKRFQEFAGQEWKEQKLSDIFERVKRRNDEGNKNVVTVSAQRGFVRQNEFFTKFVASENLDDYFLVKKGEFCYNKSYTNDYAWGATKRLKEFDKAVVTTLYICFKFKDETKHSGDFFEHFFEACALDKGLSKIAHEGGRAHGLLNVTPTDFFTLKINIPSRNEQIAIAQVLQTADKEIELLKKQLEALRKQKRGLMQKLLTGQIPVKVDDEQTATSGVTQAL